MQFVYTKLNDDYLNNDKYIAHTSSYKKSETLKEHLDNVFGVSFDLYNTYNMDIVLNNIINKINPSWVDVIKDLFFSTIYLHDYGKINPMFQTKLGNSAFDYQVSGKNTPSSIKSDSGHSIISVIVFIDYFFDKYKDESKYGNALDSIIVKFSMNILKHHSSYIDVFNEETPNYDRFKTAFEILSTIGYEFKTPDFEFSILKTFIGLIDCSNEENEYMFYLLRLNYGMLTKSDYIATTNYMNGYKHIENIVNTDDIKDKFWKKDKFKDGSDNFNSKIDLTTLDKISKTTSNDNLNNLRCHMLSESLSTLKSNIKENVFFLECPTGGGKTNISFAIIDSLIGEFDFKKVFYVFPFNKLSEQTEESFINTFHLNQNKVVSLSYDSYKELDETGVNKESSSYSTDTVNMMNNTFMNFPYLLMSNIRFFDMLKNNSKKSMYNLHTLCNSVVIIDEIQAYDPLLWSKLVYFIDEYASLFNIKFIIMSATLPKIDTLLKEDKKFVNLISDRKKYFLNNNFKSRVRFDGSYLNEKMTSSRLKDLVIDISEKYYEENETSYTIVEFIYKKSAGEFVNNYSDRFKKYGYEVMLLSSTTLKSKSFRIIKDIKTKRYKKVILVCTQTIEAGVDIDMDNGFKDTSVIDSEEQLAGRINRNASKSNNVLYLVNFGNKFIYKTDLRYDIFPKYDDKYIQVLNRKDFESVYGKIMCKINDKDSGNSEKSLSVYMRHFNKLNFGDINREMELIDTSAKNMTIFIPMKLPMDDVKLVIKNTSKIKTFITNNHLDGEKVWDEYQTLINAKRFLDIKKLQNIVSLFTTNLFMSKNIVNNITPHLEGGEDDIIKKLISLNLYDYDNGFDNSVYIDNRDNVGFNLIG